jgi:hypothetical protein
VVKLVTPSLSIGKTAMDAGGRTEKLIAWKSQILVSIRFVETLAYCPAHIIRWNLVLLNSLCDLSKVIQTTPPL